MFPGGVTVERSNSAFKEMYENGELIALPESYFRKIEKLIGKQQLKDDENVAIAIWKDDMPVQIITVIDGKLVDVDGLEKYPNYNSLQLMSLIEDELKNETTHGKIYDVVVEGEGFKLYEE